jgi:hypothetical protein
MNYTTWKTFTETDIEMVLFLLTTTKKHTKTYTIASSSYTNIY